MKDLLPKTLEIGEEKEEDEKSLREELKVTIERYRAQGFDVSALNELEGKPIPHIRSGIDQYRGALKHLKSAMTVLRSLEGYGYTKEIKAIIENIKNPDMAEQVFQEAEKLKERAFSEHNIKHERRSDTPGSRVMKSLQARSRIINGVVGKEDEPLEEETVPQEEEEESQDGVNNADLDALLNSMDGLGDDLDLNFDDLLVDGGEDESVPESPQEELPVEEEPQAVEPVPEPEPVEPPVEEPAPEPEPVPEPVEEPITPPEEEVPSPEPEETPMEESIPAEEPVPEPIPEPEAPPMEEEVPDEEPIPEPVAEPEPEPEQPPEEEETPTGEPVNLELLMEKAKDAYRTGDMVDSLSIFEQVLQNDPDNSKARFMIRRIKQKLE